MQKYKKNYTWRKANGNNVCGLSRLRPNAKKVQGKGQRAKGPQIFIVIDILLNPKVV